MNTLIKTSLEKSLTYAEYRALIKDLLAEGKSTGPQQSEELTHYSKMNQQRMNRLDKTLVLTPDTTQALALVSKKYSWLVLSEGWCGDAAQCLPILHKMAETSPHIDLKIVLRDENEELMNAYLTNGGKSIPKLLLIDEATTEEIAHWGPRPAAATQEVKDLMAKYGGVTEEVKEGLQKWYNDDKGIAIQNEIIEMMKKPAL